MNYTQTPIEMMKAVLDTVQETYDAMVVLKPVAERITVMDYVNEKLATSRVPGQLDGFGRRVQELYVQVHGANPPRERRFCGRTIRPTNVYSKQDFFLLDHAWSEQELRWKAQEVRRETEELLEACRNED